MKVNGRLLFKNNIGDCSHQLLLKQGFSIVSSGPRDILFQGHLASFPDFWKHVAFEDNQLFFGNEALLNLELKETE